jgi:hypothetical protein
MQMSHRCRRLAARFLAIGLLAATLFTVDSLASPSPAEARCKGEGNPVYSWFNFNQVVRVSETPAAGTCNGNDIYTGVLKDEAQDGYCVSVWFEIPGQGWFLPLGGNVCGAGNTSTFQWNDTNDNHQSYERFCIDKASNHEIVQCGWGNVVAINGKALNWGF